MQMFFLWCTQRVWGVRLFRVFLFWPLLLSGGICLMVLCLLYQGGVSGQVASYAHEAERWYNAPAGHILVWHCERQKPEQSAPVRGVLPQTELMSEPVNCSREAASFERVAEDDIRGMRYLLAGILMMSFFIELIMAFMDRDGL